MSELNKLKSISVAKEKLDELDIQKEKEDFNRKLNSILENTESEIIREAIKTIIELPDNDPFDYEFKVFCWNNGNFRSEKEISEAYRKTQAKKYVQSDEYKNYMNATNYAPFIICGIYIILMALQVNTWDVITSNVWFYHSLLYVIVGYFPIWGTILTIIGIVVSIYIHSANRVKFAKDKGVSPYSPEIMKHKEVKAACIAVGAVAAGFAAKAINDKVKKESQIKKDF